MLVASLRCREPRVVQAKRLACRIHHKTMVEIEAAAAKAIRAAPRNPPAPECERRRARDDQGWLDAAIAQHGCGCVLDALTQAEVECDIPKHQNAGDLGRTARVRAI